MAWGVHERVEAQPLRSALAYVTEGAELSAFAEHEEAIRVVVSQAVDVQLNRPRAECRTCN